MVARHLNASLIRAHPANLHHRRSLPPNDLPGVLFASSQSRSIAAHVRHASSSAAPAQRPPPTYSPPVKPRAINAEVNPPETTIPPPLDVADREPGQNLFSYLFKVGKGYMSFYKTGGKATWSNIKTARALRQKYNTTAAELRKNATELMQKGDFAAAFPHYIRESTILTRAESKLLERNNVDIRRLPIFALLFLVLGEWLPLIVVYIPKAIPYPCWIPRQVDRERKGIHTRRVEARKWFDAYRKSVGDAEVLKIYPKPKSNPEEVELIHAEKEAYQRLGLPPQPNVSESEDVSQKGVVYLCQHLGLYSRLWDRIGLRPPMIILRSRLSKKLKNLGLDDWNITRCGGAEGLSDAEVVMACEERGIDTIAHNEKGINLREVLRKTVKTGMEQAHLGYVNAILDLGDLPAPRKRIPQQPPQRQTKPAQKAEQWGMTQGYI